MKTIPFLMLGMILVGASWGCVQDEQVVKRTDVLSFSLPYDLTYLRTMEAVDEHPDWELSMTDKEKGIITLWNTRYSSVADADLRNATLLVKRSGPRETTVQLDPDSQAVVGGDEILSLVRQALAVEVSKR